MRIFFLFLLIFSPFAFAMPPVNKPVISVSIPPQAFVLEHIAGNTVDINTLISSQSSPATYAPTPEDMKKLAQSRIYFSIGVPFEQAWLSRFTAQNTAVQVVNVRDGFKTRSFDEMDVKHDTEHNKHHHDVPEKPKHTHHDGHNHADGIDPHIWLATDGLIHIAVQMTKTLSTLLPTKAKIFEQNLVTFKSTLDKTHAHIAAKKHRKHLLVAHPSYGYFGREFGIKQIPLEVSGKQPSLKDMIRLEHEVKTHHIKHLIIAPQFPGQIANKLATRLKLKLHTVNPIADNPLQTMKYVTNILEIHGTDYPHQH